ncbi:MAG: cation-translocating P-type ATPase [Lachnospiraceae bacterium]|jgi:heavy metal translocating P-type ATPase|nr:cation-translocating P-type ATPase [Lachnospiraceae bacterium]
MGKRINHFLTGLPMTILGGILLALSFFFPRMGFILPADPAWGTVIICGLPLLYLALQRIIHNKGISKISSALLISTAMAAAIAIGDLFAAGEVAFIMEIGAILENITTDRAKKGLKNLISLTPVQGRRITASKEEIISADMIRYGDILRVLPGEAIPVDAIILWGETSVDQSIMTGESLPVDKIPGDKVFCGTINRFGAIEIQAASTGSDSSLQKLIQMVKDAENRKAPMQRLADKAASWLVPLAMLTAAIAGIITHDIVRSVTILVVFCPCALVLATPTAIMAAIGQATKRGIIIKSGDVLEKMGKVNAIAFDKTGTLTLGKLQVSDILSFDNTISKDELLTLTASAESKSEHPLGKAINAYAAEMKLTLFEVASFQMQSGKGITGEVQGKKLHCGNKNYLLEKGIPIPSNIMVQLESMQAQGKACVMIADDNHCIGILALTDVIRPEARQIINKLYYMNVKTLLLTGDNQNAAKYFASQAGITDIKAELLPEQKVTCITEMQAKEEIVCMIGDGVNDAPALKIADVGIAMGSMGSDIAVEAADIALMSDDISKIPYLKRLSNATVATIKFSISLSMCINLSAVACSILGILNPTTGALVHNAGSCFVVLIAALLYDRKFE